jgi:hypothetical protein
MKSKKTPSNTSERSLSASPSQEEIAKRAYQLYEQNGREEGRDLEYWLEAEKSLRTQLSEPLSPMEFAETKESPVTSANSIPKSQKKVTTREEVRINAPSRQAPRQSMRPQEHSA